MWCPTMFLSLCLLLVAGSYSRTTPPLTVGPEPLFPPPSSLSPLPLSPSALSFLQRDLRYRCLTHVVGRQPLLLCLLLSGDVHPYPGPARDLCVFPCGLCEDKCRWSCEAVCCDQCSIWFHRSCISMSQSDYGNLGGQMFRGSAFSAILSM